MKLSNFSSGTGLIENTNIPRSSLPSEDMLADMNQPFASQALHIYVYLLVYALATQFGLNKNINFFLVGYLKFSG